VIKYLGRVLPRSGMDPAGAATLLEDLSIDFGCPVVRAQTRKTTSVVWFGPKVALSALGDRIEQRGERGAGGDLPPADQDGDGIQRHLLDAAGLKVILRCPDMCGAIGAVQVVHRVGDPRGRLDAEQGA
jgi:hypothetical protein